MESMEDRWLNDFSKWKCPNGCRRSDMDYISLNPTNGKFEFLCHQCNSKLVMLHSPMEGEQGGEV